MVASIFVPVTWLVLGVHFAERGFLEKLQEIAGYVISDVESFPSVRYWIVSRDIVKSWYDEGKLGAGTKISRQRALQLLKGR